MNMGRLIGQSANVEKIEEHVRAAYRVAVLRGEGIGEAARARLQPAVATIDEALAAQRQATAADSDAWAAVLVEEGKSDLVIGTIRDEMWNALGRPRLTTPLDHI